MGEYQRHQKLNLESALVVIHARMRSGDTGFFVNTIYGEVAVEIDQSNWVHPSSRLRDWNREVVSEYRTNFVAKNASIRGSSFYLQIRIPNKVRKFKDRTRMEKYIIATALAKLEVNLVDTESSLKHEIRSLDSIIAYDILSGVDAQKATVLFSNMYVLSEGPIHTLPEKARELVQQDIAKSVAAVRNAYSVRNDILGIIEKRNKK